MASDRSGSCLRLAIRGNSPGLESLHPFPAHWLGRACLPRLLQRRPGLYSFPKRWRSRRKKLVHELLAETSAPSDPALGSIRSGEAPSWGCPSTPAIRLDHLLRGLSILPRASSGQGFLSGGTWAGASFSLAWLHRRSAPRVNALQTVQVYAGGLKSARGEAYDFLRGRPHRRKEENHDHGPARHLRVFPQSA